MPLKTRVVYNHITELDVERKIYGYLPIMKICSNGHIGDMDSESYSERVNLMGKLVLTDVNSLLGDEETEIIVVICMNRDYMCFMYEHYGEKILKMQPFGMTVVTVTNKEQEIQ